MEGIKISKRLKLKNPYLICAWPGMGDVAFRAAQYLIEKLKAEEFADIQPEDFFYFSGSNVQDGIVSAPELPYSKFYYWKNRVGKNDLIIFISNAQPDLVRAEEYCKRIISLARSFKAKLVISFASMPQPIDHSHPPGVWCVATSAQLNHHLQKFDLNVLREGQISGMNGLFLGLAKKMGIEGFCLLGEIPLYTIQIENPKASQAVLETLARILNIQIDFSGLQEQAHVIEEEINRLLDYLKLDSGPAPINEEDIEKIKKSLSEFAKLPASIKEKINQLFAAAQADISKAQELKAELDKWNVYKEYEDRFLDLFKKSKGANN
jgi:proteasome assembly chaperone (PAC2) family protein